MKEKLVSLEAHQKENIESDAFIENREGETV